MVGPGGEAGSPEGLAAIGDPGGHQVVERAVVVDAKAVHHARPELPQQVEAVHLSMSAQSPEHEDALVEHPDVAEAAVVGVPDAKSGETVVAFVVACDGATPTWTELVAHLRRRLARYKIPSRIEFVTELPHTFAGKVPRRALRTLAGRGKDDATANPA